MIKVHCGTNLDDYKGEEWPKFMVCLPNIGDKVRAKSGRSLKVCGITHCFVFEKSVFVDEYEVGKPYVEIELHKEI